MPNKKNVNSVKNLESKLETTQALYLADYQGLSVKDQTELRRRVKEAGGELTIAKNRLLKIAMRNKGFEVESIDTFLKGSNITLFAQNDPIAPLKALVDFSSKNEKELPAIKMGILDKKALSIKEVLHLASLPSKTELIAKLLGTLTNPARNMVGVLSAPIRNFVYALNAIKERK